MIKIRDLEAQLNGDDEVICMPSGGLEIVGDDGKILFTITLKGNVLRVDGGNICRHEGKILDNEFLIEPRASNYINLIKKELSLK